MDISPETRIQDLLKEHPGAAKVLEDYGMMCTGCGGAQSDTIKHAAQNHGLVPDELIQALRKSAR